MATQLWAMGLVGLTSFVSAAGAIYIKKGADKLQLSFSKLVRNYDLIAGVGLNALAVFMFVPSLKGGDVSVLFPIISLNYIWVALAGPRFLGEQMNTQKWIGVCLIALGVALIGLGS